MFATGHPGGNHLKVWRLFLCLTLLSFLFRSTVPAGYMPGLSGHGNRTLTVALCSMDGVIGLKMANPGNQAPHPSGHDDTHRSCLFCSVVSQAVAPGTGTLATAPTVVPHRVVLARYSERPLPVTFFGPPLGARAPPAILG